MHSKPYAARPDEPRPLWSPASYSLSELEAALVAGRMAGPITSHDRRNVLWKIDRMIEGDPDAMFGLTGLGGFTVWEVLDLMADEAGFDPDPAVREGPMLIDPARIVRSLVAAGRRLHQAADQGERVLLATGHPAGLPLLYAAVGDLLEERGAKLLRPAWGLSWRDGVRRREIRYLHGVGVLTDRGSTIHTHSPAAMERMLEEERPDLVFADHGFAGAAIEAGVETISIADINDPPPVVAKAQGRTDLVIVMDDNVQPEDYWPCYQAIASALA